MKKSKIDTRKNRVNRVIETVIREYTSEFSEGLEADGIPGDMLTKKAKEIDKKNITDFFAKILEVQGYPSERKGFWLTFLNWKEDHSPEISDGAEVY